jgi:hypothetical protein
MMRHILPWSAGFLLAALIIVCGVHHPAVCAQSAPSRWRLAFSTYLGGSTPCVMGGAPLTFAQNAASDAQGDTYVTGATQVSDLPIRNAFQAAPAAGSAMSAFVAKYDPAGQLLWCTFLGGDNQSMGIGAAATPTGGVAVVGLTSSDATGPFPSKNAFQAANNGESDYFVAVFDADGALLYSTYLGGSGVEGAPQPNTFTDDSNNGDSVAVDAAGLIYVTGVTDSGDDKAVAFPTTANAIQKTLAGGKDAFLAIIDPTRSGSDSLTYSSFLGGSGDDKGHSVAVEASGSRIAVAGLTSSRDFPTTSNALRHKAPPIGFISNGFVTWIASSQPGASSSQYAMPYSTYLGADASDARDDVYGIALDPKGRIVATGRTQSKDFPMTSGGAAVFNSAPYLEAGVSGDEPYVVKIDPSLDGEASLAYATFLGGGSQNDQWGSFATSIGIDAKGTVYVAGETCAPGHAYDPADRTAPQTFPYTPTALFPALQGSWDVLFMRIEADGASLGYSTHLGGTGGDRAYGLAVDPAGNVAVAGLTFSDDYPLHHPAQTWPGNTGNQNAFVTRFVPNVAFPCPLLLLMGE